MALLHVQKSHALWAVELVAARCNEICVEIFHRKLAESLYGIGVEYDIRSVLSVEFPYGAAYRHYRLDRTDFIVYGHH